LTLKDSVPVDFGGVSYILHSTSDANANCLVLDFPVGGAVDVPVFIAALSDTDFAYFNGQTQPAIAVEDVAGTGAIYMSHSADDIGIIGVKGATTEIQIVATTLTFTGAVGFTGAQVITGDFSVDGALALIDGSTSVRLVSAGFVSLESPANRFGVSASIYMQVTTAVTTGITTITHTGSAPAVTWTADSFAFIGDVVVGAAGGNAGMDFFAYGKLDGSFIEWDEDANDAGRFKVVNASTRLSCSRNAINECALSITQTHDTDAAVGESQGGNGAWITYVLAAANTNESESGYTLMTGVHGDMLLDGTINGSQVHAVGVMGEIRGAGAITECAHIAAVYAKNNNAINPTTGTKSLFYGENIAGTVDYGLLLEGTITTAIGIGPVTTAFALPAAGTAPVVASATGAGVAAEGSVVITIDGTPKYLQYFAGTA